jgi:hypothetical protein
MRRHSTWFRRRSTLAATGFALAISGCAGGVHSAAVSSANTAAPTTSTGISKATNSSTTQVAEPTLPPQPVVAGSSPIATGIQNITQAPFSQQDFRVTNQYFGPFQQGRVHVFAGATVTTNADGSQSVVAPGVRLFEGADSSRYVGQYLIVGKNGEATITSVSGQIVSLSLTDGSSFQFDLVSHAFTS